MITKITPSQELRVMEEWSGIAGEPMRIECSDLDSPVYAFGSELGCLRLFHKMPNGRLRYSQNMKTWCYSNK